jgi:hypothetical protein
MNMAPQIDSSCKQQLICSDSKLQGLTVAYWVARRKNIVKKILDKKIEKDKLEQLEFA